MGRGSVRSLALVVACLLLASPVTAGGAVTSPDSGSSTGPTSTADGDGFNVTVSSSNATVLPRDVAAAGDGGAYVLVDTDGDRDDVYRVSPEGDVEWTRPTDVVAGTVVSDGDGAVVAGYVNASDRGGRERWVLAATRYAPDGRVEWTRRYPDVVAYGAPEPGETYLTVGGAATGNGTVLAGGVWYGGVVPDDAGPNASAATGWTAELGEDGTVRSTRRRTGPTYGEVVPRPGGGYVLLDYQVDEFFLDDNASEVLVGTDPDGSVDWRRSPDGHVGGIAAGSNATFASISAGFERFVVAYTPDGSVDWRSSYRPIGHENPITIAWDVAAVDGGPLVLDGAATQDARSKGYLSRFDAGGDLLWSWDAITLARPMHVAVADSLAVVAAANGAPSRSVRVVATPLPPPNRTLAPGTDGVLPPVKEGLAPPTDPDDDGLYEDVDGDGTFDRTDVAVFLKAFDGPAVQDHADAYDFSGDETVNIVDVAVLEDRI